MTAANDAPPPPPRVTVDAGALEAFMREAIHLIDDVAPDSDGRRFVANLASELDAAIAPLTPTVVDAGTLLPVEEWISDVLILRDHADSEDRDILTRTAERLRILATAAQPARAVLPVPASASCDCGGCRAVYGDTPNGGAA